MADFAHCIRGRVFTRRTFLVGLAGIAAGFVIRRLIAASPGLASQPTGSLRSAPLELGGVWKSSPADAVLRVLSRVREVSLEGLRLLSDRQPDKLYVDDHPNGLPAVWLHDDHTNSAWIIVDIGPADWSKLAYQFGHELGHVLGNSWAAASKPGPPLPMAGRSDGRGVFDPRARPPRHELGAQSSLCGQCSLRRRTPRIPGEFDQKLQGSRRTSARARD